MYATSMCRCHDIEPPSLGSLCAAHHMLMLCNTAPPLLGQSICCTPCVGVSRHSTTLARRSLCQRDTGVHSSSQPHAACKALPVGDTEGTKPCWSLDRALLLNREKIRLLGKLYLALFEIGLSSCSKGQPWPGAGEGWRSTLAPPRPQAIACDSCCL